MLVIDKIKSLNENEIETFIQKRIEELRKTDPASSFGAGIRLPVQPTPTSANIFKHYINENNREIYPVGGLECNYSYIIDTTEETAKALFDGIRKNDVKNFPELFTTVSKVIFDYFGGQFVEGSEDDRFNHLVDVEDLPDGEFNKLSVFKESKHAWCVERACVAHQLFQLLGLDSELVISPITINGTNGCHAFNLLKINNEVVWFDSSLIDCSKNLENYDPILVRNLPLACYDNPKQIEFNILNKNGTTSTIKTTPTNSLILNKIKTAEAEISDL